MIAASLRTHSHAAYDSAFRADVVRLDQRATGLIDQYLPQLTNAQIKTLAQRMRDATLAEENSSAADGCADNALNAALSFATRRRATPTARLARVSAQMMSHSPGVVGLAIDIAAAFACSPCCRHSLTSPACPP